MTLTPTELTGQIKSIVERLGMIVTGLTLGRTLIDDDAADITDDDGAILTEC